MPLNDPLLDVLVAVEPPSPTESLLLDLGVAASCVAVLVFGIVYFVRNRRR
ncbi:hypothetical protein [Actinokineospora bangkokensis]|uniref:hypothetical protein n=1 Tax=Actinokineospora bangkokensis TaxID=1193682 RepID=UPI000AC99E93|nr:hypothetical protein [Actinokineospora bangkokensis]